MIQDGVTQPAPLIPFQKRMIMEGIKTSVLTVLLVAAVAAQAHQYPTKLLNHEREIDHIISSMTLEEKVDMLHGKNMFSSAGIPRLGIADIEYADGPFGIREEMEPHSWNSLNLTTDSATFQQAEEPTNISARILC